MDAQPAAYTFVGFTHLPAWTPCGSMWVSHGGMVHPNWLANPQQLHMCSVAAFLLHAVCSCVEHYTIWMAMLVFPAMSELFSVFDFCATSGE